MVPDTNISEAKAFSDFLSDSLLLTLYADDFLKPHRMDHSVELLGKVAKSLGYRVEPIADDEPTINRVQLGITAPVASVR